MTQQDSGKKKFWQKRIPTLVGIGVLIVALVVGTLYLGQGTGVFAPRATPETTPKKIKLTNVTDSSFTVTFFTDEQTTGFVKYGTEEGKLRSQASDDRDQLSGSVSPYSVHHITVRGLEPNATYYYTLGTTSGNFDNNGQPFTVRTARKAGVPSAAKTVYGSVVTPAGSPADGAVVYVAAEGIGEMSSLVKNSGSWAIPLSNARTPDGSGYATIEDSTVLTITVQGTTASLTSQLTVTVAEAQPVANITLGQSGAAVTTTPQATPDTATTSADLNTATDSADLSALDSTPSASPTARGGLNELVTSSTESASVSEATAAAVTAIDLETATAAAPPTVTTANPTITGKAVPNVVVTIQVNSDTQINAQLTTDANGNFVLDIAQLSQELEPGEHTVTYSYVDPTTGETVTKTQTFFVEDTSDTSSQIAQADTGDTTEPYGSSNPFPIGGTSTESGVATSSATSSARTTIPSTSSGVPVSGSVGTTFALVFGGLFFIVAAAWSFWIAQQLEAEEMA